MLGCIGCVLVSYVRTYVQSREYGGAWARVCRRGRMVVHREDGRNVLEAAEGGEVEVDTRGLRRFGSAVSGDGECMAHTRCAVA